MDKANAKQVKEDFDNWIHSIIRKLNSEVSDKDITVLVSGNINYPMTIVANVDVTESFQFTVSPTTWTRTSSPSIKSSMRDGV